MSWPRLIRGLFYIGPVVSQVMQAAPGKHGQPDQQAGRQCPTRKRVRCADALGQQAKAERSNRREPEAERQGARQLAA